MKHAEQMAFFREVTLRITRHLDAGAALLDTMRYLAEHVPVDGMGLHYIDNDARAIRAIAHVTTTDERIFRHDDPDARTDIDDKTFDHLFKYKPPLKGVEIINRPDPLLSVLNSPWMQMDPAHCSFLILPLIIEDESFGVLVIMAKENDRYRPYHATLLELVKEPISLAMSNARRYHELEQLKNRLADNNRALQRDMTEYTGNHVIGAEYGLRYVMDMVKQVAPTDSPVLVLGETGTGKEVIANAIHRVSHRQTAPMIRVPCGAIPETLLDSELFGHEKGAFTGAAQMKRGRFERADGGTLFLDEIAELSQEAQVKLLRVLQEREFERVGGSSTLRINVRVIAATHRNLEQMVADGAFRQDLWFRLNVFPIRLPPLRERRSDILSLAQFFVERKAREMNLHPMPYLSLESVKRLTSYTWPGNVRELQNVIERALILCRDSELKIPVLQQTKVRAVGIDECDREEIFLTIDEAMKRHIEHALEKTRYRIEGPKGAAHLLDINPSTLRARMKKLSISYT